MAGRHIGLDLDNTIIDYDEAFAQVGREIGLLGPTYALCTKDEVKSFLCTPARGEHDWMRLQGQVYGRYIDRARLCPGVAEFLHALQASGERISIISHKTRYGHFDPHRVNLWEAARAFLERQGFFTARGFGLDRNDVHFTETREGKIETIARIGCDVFIDDLPEVLLHPGFPRQTIRLWFAADKRASAGEGLHPHRSWGEILAVLQAPAHSG